MKIEKKAKKLIKSWYKLTKDYNKALHCALWEAEYNMHLAPCKVKAVLVVKHLRELLSNQTNSNEKMYTTDITPFPFFSRISSTKS